MNNALSVCRHCGWLYDKYREWKYCPSCGGLLERPNREDVDLRGYFSVFGTYAYCLPDILNSEWEDLDRGMTQEARERFHDNEWLTMRSAYIVTAKSWMSIPDSELKSFFAKKKYGVIALMKEGFYLRRREDWMDCDSQEGTFDWMETSDVVMRGYIKNDCKRVERDIVIPGELWDQLRDYCKRDEIPIDSEIVFKTSDCIGGRWGYFGWDDDGRDFESGELRVDEISEIKRGNPNVGMQVLMSRSVIAERNRKLFTLPPNIKV